MSQPADSFDPLDLALLVAHQLQSPITAAGSLIKALQGGYAGPLTDQQKDYIAKAGARCDEAIASVRRMLAIARAINAGAPPEPMDLAVGVRRAHQQYNAQASERSIALTVIIEDEPAPVRLSREAMEEIIEAVVGNAFKYTPDHGRIRLSVRCDRAAGRALLSVADSGVGIAPEDRHRVFEPFHRSQRARASTRTGTGLGLMFVKTVVLSAGGTVRADQADLGGADILIELPLVEPAAAPVERERPPRGRKVVIVGGVAAGPKVASKVIRLDPAAEVAIVERGKFLSYAGCGLPYYVSNVVRNQRELMSTPAGVVRDAVFFQKVRNVQVRNDTLAVRIDRPGKRVLVRDLLDGQESWLEYDKLVLATGATPIVPQAPGTDLSHIFTLHGVQDAEGIRTALAETQARDVVMVGGGLIGVEFTGSLAAKGCRVTIVEKRPQILPILDADMARLVALHLESRGVRVLTGTTVQRFEGREGRVSAVVTEAGTLPADLVILGIGVRPNVELAREAGLEIGQTGGVKVDEYLRTSDPDIFAAGDCVESTHLVTGRPCYSPMGSLANKQGRVVAVNVCGGSERFPGVIGSVACRVFDYCVARTGLTESQARAEGFQVVTALAPGPDAEHFMPSARPLLLKIVVDARTRRLLGAQGVGPGRADKRIDVAAVAITAGMTVDQLANADLCYAPHYSSAMDNIITAANVARNKLDGHMVGICAEDLYGMMTRAEEFVLLDVRTPGEYEQVRLPGSVLIPLGSLRGRLDELPRDKTVVAFDNISLRGYEAALILRAHGFTDVRVLDGGLDMWPYKKLH